MLIISRSIKLFDLHFQLMNIIDIMKFHKSNKQKVICFFFLLFFSGSIQGQEISSEGVKFCTWFQDKEGAISISFDDACYTQYEYAFPILEKYNLKATFSLVGEWTHNTPTYSSEPNNFEVKKMGWNEIMELHQKGHEIAAHGFIHQKYDNLLPKEQIVRQMKDVKELIESKILSQTYTLHYPYSFTSEKIITAAKEAGFLFCRTGMDSINNANPKNMNYLDSKAILNNNTPDSTQLCKWISDAKGKWLILMYHHLFPENSKEMNILNAHQVKNTYSLYPKTFESQINLLVRSNYWIAPIVNIGKYVMERNNTKIQILKHRRKIVVTTNTEMDTSIYNQPLSIKIKTSWEKVVIKGSLNDGVFETTNNYLIITVLPRKSITILKKR